MIRVILMMGLNHTTAPVEVREKVASVPCTQKSILSQLQDQLDPDLFSESLVLSTCNRTEIYAVTSDRLRGLALLMRQFQNQETFGTVNANHLYSYWERDAVAHLFAVTSGIDSMIIGEFEILGQVRNAYLRSVERNSIGPILHRLFKDAIHTGKRAHAETEIGTGAASVAYAAVVQARKQLGSLNGRQALVVGTGTMGTRAAKNLAADGACTVMVTNRTFSHAAEVAGQVGGRAVHYDELAKSLADADLVVSATGAPHVILTAPMIQLAMESRPDRPLCLFDIAVPRDIDPQAATIPNVHLSNIDDLVQFVDDNRAARERAVSEVKGIIAEETEAFWKWFAERRAAPIIATLHEHAEVIRRAELEKALKRLGHLHLSDRDRNVIASLSAGIVSKLLAAPTVHLKEHVQQNDSQIYFDALRDLFELDSNEQTDFTSTV